MVLAKKVLAVKVLVIEDDPHVAGFLVKALREAGASVDHAADGKEGLFLASAAPHDVMVVDRMLPGLDGLAIVRALRAAGDRTPVLILRAGGDDYLVKPFAFSELHARLEALLRRSGSEAPATRLQVSDLEMDLLARTVTRAGRPVDLQPREFRLLEYLMRHAGQVVTRTMLLEHVWDYHFDPQTNVIDVHVSRLRRKIDRDFETPLLHTVRGAGYVLRAPA